MFISGKQITMKTTGNDFYCFRPHFGAVPAHATKKWRNADMITHSTMALPWLQEHSEGNLCFNFSTQKWKEEKNPKRQRKRMEEVNINKTLKKCTVERTNVVIAIIKFWNIMLKNV